MLDNRRHAAITINIILLKRVVVRAAAWLGLAMIFTMGSGYATELVVPPMNSNATFTPTAKSESPMLVVTSSAFVQNAPIPLKYTCDGQDISPPLSWRGAPSNTRSFAVIADDPDAPMGTWIHWLLFDIPATASSLPAAIPQTATLTDGSRYGTNSWGQQRYGGPCPPSGTHRYFFKVYALDVQLALPADVTNTQLLQKMQGHILAKGELMGVYRRR